MKAKEKTQMKKATRHNTGLMCAVVSCFTLVSCSPLSKRTDEQAWIDYVQEQKLKRLPASALSPEKFSEIPVRKILLSCNQNQQLESCYRSKVTVAFDAAFKNEPGYKKLQQEFLNQYSYEKVYNDVQNFHQVLLSGMDLRASDHVRELHRQCEDHDEIGANVQSYQPFLGGDTDIPKGYYSCLNEEWNRDQEGLLQETSERLGLTIVTAEAKQWIRDRQIQQVYETVTHDWFQKKLREDRERFEKNRADIAARIHKNESLQTMVKRLSAELRTEYKFLPIEVALTELYKGVRRP